ncbi:MAG: hypothetical protein ACP5NS_03060 [Candidatus Pacearchaeota archaeon]
MDKLNRRVSTELRIFLGRHGEEGERSIKSFYQSRGREGFTTYAISRGYSLEMVTELAEVLEERFKRLEIQENR